MHKFLLGGFMVLFKKLYLMMICFGLLVGGSYSQNEANCLISVNTATWCHYCPNAVLIFTDLREQYRERAPIIAWHPTSDPFGTAFTQNWINKCGNPGYPTLFADYVLKTIGANADFKNQAATRLAVSRELSVSVYGNTSNATILIRNDSLQAISANLMAVMVERLIQYPWQTKKDLDFVARFNCFDEDFGKSITVLPGGTIEENVNYDLSSVTYPSGASPAIDGPGFELVAFVYNPDNLNVYQAAFTEIKKVLKANFSHNASASSLAVNFTDLSSDNIHTIVAWEWNFGDGETSTEQHPVHVFEPGVFTVTLSVTNDADPAETDKVKQTIPVGTDFYCASYGKSAQNHWIAGVKAGDLVNMSGSDNGYFDYSENFTWTADIGESYNVILTPGFLDVSGPMYWKIWMDLNADKTFDEESECVYDSGNTSFNEVIDTMTIPLGAVPGFTRMRVAMKYLNESDPDKPSACMKFDIGEVEDYKVFFGAYCPKPIPDFEHTKKATKVNFTDTSQCGGDPATAITSWLWYFGEGPDYLGTSTEKNPSFVFPEYGIFEVTLKVTNDCGKSMSISQPIYVYPGLVADFTYQINGRIVYFNDQSSPGEAPALAIVQWNWSFLQGNTLLGVSNEQNPSFAFPDYQSYTAILNVTNDAGNIASVNKKIVLTAPKFNFLVGVFPEANGLWQMIYQNGAVNWERLSYLLPDMIRSGDINGNGRDDLGCLFKSANQFWVRYDNGQWKKNSNLSNLKCFDWADMNGDGLADIVCSSYYLFWMDAKTLVINKISNYQVSHLAAGDFDGDGKGDLVGLFPQLNSIWVFTSKYGQWTKISNNPSLYDIRSYDFDKDKKAKIYGSWDLGIFEYDPIGKVWRRLYWEPADRFCPIDLFNTQKISLIGSGNWAIDNTGLWHQQFGNSYWLKISEHTPNDITGGSWK
jgi:PKD repeat protein